MYYPEYLKSEVEKLHDLLATDMDIFINREKLWIEKNLSLLYKRYEVLDAKLRVNPYVKIIKHDDGNKISHNLIIPKFMALQELVIYWWALDGVDLFIESLYNYGGSITGKEIVELSCQDDARVDRCRLEERLNIVIRKFLSYQYLIIDK